MKKVGTETESATKRVEIGAVALKRVPAEALVGARVRRDSVNGPTGWTVLRRDPSMRYGGDEVRDESWWPAVSGRSPDEDERLSSRESSFEALRLLQYVSQTSPRPVVLGLRGPSGRVVYSREFPAPPPEPRGLALLDARQQGRRR